MYILAMETTGPLGSVALINENSEIWCQTSAETMSHLKDLMPMATSALQAAGVSARDITAVAASIGPGSFTGIRIGVSSARAIAQALGLPCVSVPTLESFRPVGRGTDSCAAEYSAGTTLTAPIFNARRGQVYGAVFTGDGEDVLAPGPYMLDDVLKAITDFAGDSNEISVKFYGDGINAYEKKIEEYFSPGESENFANNIKFIFAGEPERYQSADRIAAIALRKYKAGETCGVNQLLPDYMRVAEAEQKLKSGVLEKERKAKLARMK